MIDMTRMSVACMAILSIVCLAVSPALGNKKIMAYKAQTTYSFVNSETEPVFGLKVILSSAGEVKKEQATGQVGPFRDIKGNGTKAITLTNPESPIEPGSERFDLVFGTYAKKIQVTKWWWVDAKGKRIGQKKKG